MHERNNHTTSLWGPKWHAWWAACLAVQQDAAVGDAHDHALPLARGVKLQHRQRLPCAEAARLSILPLDSKIRQPLLSYPIADSL